MENAFQDITLSCDLLYRVFHLTFGGLSVAVVLVLAPFFIAVGTAYSTGMVFYLNDDKSFFSEHYHIYLRAVFLVLDRAVEEDIVLILVPSCDLFKRFFSLDAGKKHIISASEDKVSESAENNSSRGDISADIVAETCGTVRVICCGMHIVNCEQNEQYLAVKAVADEENSAVLPICAQIEADIADMDAEEKELFLSDLTLNESGLARIIKTGYSLLGLISFLTAGPQEVRAWTITKGTKAPQAAGKIHTDFEKGFIRAEVVSFDDLVKCGGMTGAKEKGLVRLEGKEYVMQDGDVVLFRFNV